MVSHPKMVMNWGNGHVPRPPTRMMTALSWPFLAKSVCCQTWVRSQSPLKTVLAARAMPPGTVLTIEACDETMDFRNATVVLTPTASSLKLMTGGPGGIVLVQDCRFMSRATRRSRRFRSRRLRSSSTASTDSTSVYIVASTTQGDEVGMADVMVTGDALISLFGDNVEAKVDRCLRSNSATSPIRLMIRADADESLNDGDTKTATITLTAHRRGCELAQRLVTQGDGSGGGRRPGWSRERRSHGDRRAATTITATANRAVTADDDAVKIADRGG